MMTPLYASQAVSVTDLKRNTSAILSQLTEPLVVLNHNRPEAYILSAEYYEKLMDIIEDLEDAELVRQRQGGPYVEVTLEDLKHGDI